MKTKIQEYVIHSNQMTWQPLVENGIRYEGVYVKSLHYNVSKKRSTTILLKFEPGAFYPYHNHPGGEELFILEGDAIIENVILSEGDFLYTPPDSKHGVRTDKGCVIYFMVPEEVEIL